MRKIVLIVLLMLASVSFGVPVAFTQERPGTAVDLEWDTFKLELNGLISELCRAQIKSGRLPSGYTVYRCTQESLKHMGKTEDEVKLFPPGKEVQIPRKKQGASAPVKTSAAPSQTGEVKTREIQARPKDTLKTVEIKENVRVSDEKAEKVVYDDRIGILTNELDAVKALMVSQAASHASNQQSAKERIDELTKEIKTITEGFEVRLAELEQRLSAVTETIGSPQKIESRNPLVNWENQKRFFMGLGISALGVLVFLFILWRSTRVRNRITPATKSTITKPGVTLPARLVNELTRLGNGRSKMYEILVGGRPYTLGFAKTNRDTVLIYDDGLNNPLEAHPNQVPDFIDQMASSGTIRGISEEDAGLLRAIT